MPAEATREFVQEWTETAWNRGDLTLVDRYMPASCVLRQSDGVEIHGPEEFKQFMLQFRTAFPDPHFTLRDAIGAGDRLAWRVTGRGTHDGMLMGIPPTGRAIEVDAVIPSHFADGKWAEDYVVLDAPTMLQQLGAVPAPARAG